MPRLIKRPTRVEAAGNKPKLIDEYIGLVNNGESAVSIAHMRSPAGWAEPGQTPEFDEYTLVLRGVLRVESRGGTLDVHAGQAVVVRRGRVGPLRHAGRGGGRVRRRLPARLLTPDRAS
jgi:hypothetical protein